MKKYFIIILVLIGINFAVSGQNKEKIKQSDEIVYKLKIDNLQSQLDAYRNKDYLLSVLFPLGGSLFGVFIGGFVASCVQKSKNKSDEKLKKIELNHHRKQKAVEFNHHREQKAQDWFEKEVMSNITDLICYYGAVRILIQEGSLEQTENLQEPLYAISRISLFTGNIANIINFHVTMTCFFSEIEVHVLKEYCNLLNNLYNCLLKQTIKKRSDVAIFKDGACKKEIDELNTFLCNNINKG